MCYTYAKALNSSSKLSIIKNKMCMKKKQYEKAQATIVALDAEADLLTASNPKKYDGSLDGKGEIGEGGDSGENPDFEINAGEHWGDLWEFEDDEE